MPCFNRVLLIGNLTRDPQLKNLSSGTVVTEFGLATNRKWKDAQGQDKEDVCFVDCSSFGKQAETINQWCKKGQLLFVEGRLKLDQWENDGQKRSKLTVVVEGFQFLGSRSEGDGGGDARPPAQRQSAGAKPGRADSPFGQPAPTLEEADIPF